MKKYPIEYNFKVHLHAVKKGWGSVNGALTRVTAKAPWLMFIQSSSAH